MENELKCYYGHCKSEKKKKRKLKKNRKKVFLPSTMTIIIAHHPILNAVSHNNFAPPAIILLSKFYA
jgi:hypothetical protein